MIPIKDSFFAMLILVPAIMGICVFALLMIVRKKTGEKRNSKSGGYLTGYVICVAINVFVLVISMGFLLLPCFIMTFGPLVFFSFKINRRIILDTKIHIKVFSFMYKFIATFVIWFIALFPFSLRGIESIIFIPFNIAKNLEIKQLQEEISAYETYADLTPFGLGIYKLKSEGDKNLWDITKPEDYVIEYDGVDIVYENHINRREEQNWDNDWSNSNKGKDVLYDVYFYEGTYIIVTPLWEKPGTLYYWGYIYLCKDIARDVDLFDIGILDPKVVENLSELPGEKLSRKELSEKLGKEF